MPWKVWGGVNTVKTLTLEKRGDASPRSYGGAAPCYIYVFTRPSCITNNYRSSSLQAYFRVTYGQIYPRTDHLFDMSGKPILTLPILQALLRM